MTFHVSPRQVRPFFRPIFGRAKAAFSQWQSRGRIFDYGTYSRDHSSCRMDIGISLDGEKNKRSEGAAVMAITHRRANRAESKALHIAPPIIPLLTPHITRKLRPKGMSRLRLGPGTGPYALFLSPSKN